MKPSPFEHFVPTTVGEAVALLAEHGDAAKVLAGGQSLVPLMNLRLAAPEVIVDLNRIPELSGVRVEGDGLVVGAMTRHREVASSEAVREACPLLADAAALVGYSAIRNRGTLGGSLAHADPASELPCVALTLDAEIVAAGAGGSRAIPAREFFVSHFTTALEPGELIVEVRFPRRRAGEGWEFVEFTRKSGDFALAAIAADVTRTDGRVESARIGVAGVSATPWRATDAEAQMAGAEAGDAALERAAASAGARARELTADRADGGYRAHLVETLTRRALSGAIARTGSR